MSFDVRILLFLALQLFWLLFPNIGRFFHNTLAQNKPHPTRVEQLIVPIPGLGCEYWFNLKKDAWAQLIMIFGPTGSDEERKFNNFFFVTGGKAK